MNNRVERLRKISRLLDSQFEGPFGFRFGLDPLIGLIPVLGDALTSLISFYIVLESYQLGCSPAVLARMVLHIFLEDLVKVVPGVGQIFDFFWKSNLKNIDLLEKYMKEPQKTRRHSVLLLGVLIMSFLLVMTAVLVATVLLVAWIVRKIS